MISGSLKTLVLLCGMAWLVADASVGFERRGGGGHRAGGMAGGGRRLGGEGFRGGGTLAGGGFQAARAERARPIERPVSRPSSGSAGGRLPNRTAHEGGARHVDRAQVASKIQSRPKGSGSALPSLSGDRRPSGAARGDKGNFPNLAARGGNPERLAGRTPAAPGSGNLGQRLTPGGGNRLLDQGKFADWSKGRSPQWHQAVQNRQNYWGKWSAENGPKLANFQQNRNQNWAGVHNFWNNRSPTTTFNKSEWNNYRNQVRAFRDNRSVEINNSVQNHFDNNFDDHWWRSCGWYGGPAVSGGNPWWWWGAATVATAGTFLALEAIHEANQPPPPVYDYGVNVVYQGKEVYVDGKPAATATEYARQARALADSTPANVSAPMPPPEGKSPEWLPLGVWALAQEREGDAYMFFQISVDKDGVVSGAYKNVLSGEQAPISGKVDKRTQRVAWKIGDNAGTTIETGVQNLTQDVASCLVHFGEETAQTWLLVRLKQPELPSAPQTPPAEQGKTAGP